MGSAGTLRVEIYVTDPHRMTVGWLNIDMGLIIDNGQIQVVVDGDTRIEEDRKAVRKATPGAIMYADALGGRYEVGSITKEDGG